MQGKNDEDRASIENSDAIRFISSDTWFSVGNILFHADLIHRRHEVIFAGNTIDSIVNDHFNAEKCPRMRSSFESKTNNQNSRKSKWIQFESRTAQNAEESDHTISSIERI